MTVSEDFRRACAEGKSACPQYILDQLEGRGPGGAGVLSLSSGGCSVAGFRALAAVLQNSDCIYQLDLANCLLTSDSLNTLIQGLTKNTSVKTIYMKGNNISGNTVATLGRLLRQNHTVSRLSLEWNCVGLDQDCFSGLCAGLATNQALELLDLRNNQLTHQAVIALSSALRLNTTLKHLDLRWNNIGLLGGQALLEVLQANPALSRVDLQGNHIPKEILRAVESQLVQNVERSQLESKSCTLDTQLRADSQLTQHQLDNQLRAESQLDSSLTHHQLETQLRAESQLSQQQLDSQLSSVRDSLCGREGAGSRASLLLDQEEQMWWDDQVRELVLLPCTQRPLVLQCCTTLH